MSWHYLQEGEAASWQGSCLDGAPFALLRLMPGRGISCLIGNVTGFWSNSQFGTTCEPLTVIPGAEVLMSLPEAFHARTLASVEQAQESTANDLAFGWKWSESFAKFDPASLLWKTRQYSLLGGLAEYSATWPQWGWMRGGECSELPLLEQRIIVPGFTWLLTPTAQSWRAWTFRNPSSLIRRRHADGNLQEQLMRLYRRMTTPRCQEILMMWPEGWTDSRPLAMDGFRLWRQEQCGC